MRRKNVFIAHGITLIAATALLTAADDVQVIQSRRATLSIYSYGGTVPSRAIPEYRDAARPPRRNTGSLTDVAEVPPLAVSVPPVKASASATPALASSPRPKRMTTQATTFGTSSMSAPSDAPNEFVLEPLPIARTVTVAWNPSPEPSVAGYHVYTGDSSGQYTDRAAVGNQTSAQVVVGQSTIYIAVSAYTSEGLESPLSDELIVRSDSLETSATSGGPQVIDSGIH